MRSLLFLPVLSIVAACSTPATVEPSLAPRAAEAIDPRVPIPDAAPIGTVDSSLAARLEALVSTARGGVPAFEAQKAETSRLAAGAGAMASEGWIAAQQALSRLVEQHGVTTQVAADIDKLASDRLVGQHWIRPADREAIAAAAAQVGSINEAQAAAINRLSDQLSH
jgi:hypothetical protein